MDSADIFKSGLAKLHPIFVACLTANVDMVSRIIDDTTPGSKERTEVLEGRVSQMRLTPLMVALTGENTIQLTDKATGNVKSLTEPR